jgi:hypothetical protein
MTMTTAAGTTKNLRKSSLKSKINHIYIFNIVTTLGHLSKYSSSHRINIGLLSS